MPTVTTHYVIRKALGRRGHRVAAVDLVSPLTTNVQSNGTYQAWAGSPLTFTDNGQAETAYFAFWSTTGTDGGNIVSFSPQLTAPVGSSDVTATAWYVEAGGPGTGEGTGWFLDAFDVDLGDFVDDDFVSVDGNAALSAAVNETGGLDTAAGHSVVSFGTCHGAPWLDWEMITLGLPTQSQGGNALTLAAQSWGIGFAFYKTPARQGGGFTGPHRQYEAGTWVSWGVMVDGGGPTGNGPVDPWGPLIRELAAGFALAEATRLVAPELRAGLAKLAAQQVKIASAGLQKSIEGGKAFREE